MAHITHISGNKIVPMAFSRQFVKSCLTKASLRLACHLLHCRYVAWSLLGVSDLQPGVAALSSHAAFSFSPSDIALKLNRSQLSAICHFGQSGGVINELAWCCLLLGLPSVANGACAVLQISSLMWQAASWKQHKFSNLSFVTELLYCWFVCLFFFRFIGHTLEHHIKPIPFLWNWRLEDKLTQLNTEVR